jgi:hypothetical protein
MVKKNRDEKSAIRGIAYILEYQFGGPGQYSGMTHKDWLDDAEVLLHWMEPGEILAIARETKDYLETGLWCGFDILAAEEGEDPFPEDYF